MKFAGPSLFTCLALATTPAAEIPLPTETGVLLNASSLLPPELLRGSSYRVRDQVPTDGYLAHFQIDSDFGSFEAVGVPAVRRRIGEIEAIGKLVETSKGDLFAEGLKRSINQPIDAVKNIVRDPVESVKQAPKTVGHFFGKVGRSIGRGVEGIVDRTQEEGPSPTAGEAGSGIGNVAKSAAGYDKAKLDTARQLGIDPYSDNPRLQEEMEKVTWAFFAGGLPLRIGAAAASAGLAVTATNMVGLPEETYALTAGELTLRDERSMAVMGVLEEDIQAFQRNPALSITRRHRIVAALEALPKTQGRGLMVRLANACEVSGQADILVAALEMIAARQAAGAGDFPGMKVIGRLPGAVDADGGLYVPAPVDFVTWTEEVAAFANREDLGDAPRTLLHTGTLSPAATAGLTAAGWRMIAVPYPAP